MVPQKTAISLDSGAQRIDQGTLPPSVAAVLSALPDASEEPNDPPARPILQS
jgi:hypothetical protein